MNCSQVLGQPFWLALSLLLALAEFGRSVNQMRLTFSTRDLLGATTAVAILLGCLFWLSTMFSIDPNSERVTVLGADTSINWDDLTWQPGMSGMGIPVDQLTPADGWTGGVAKKMNEMLLSIEYSDYFGNPVYRATISLDGLRSDDWKEYILTPTGRGGGTVDGATRANVIWNPESMTLDLEVVQYINRARIAKSTRMRFTVGNENIVVHVTEQSHAPKPPQVRS